LKSSYAAYDNLSPALRTYVESLTALHSGLAQGGKDHLRHQRRPPVRIVEYFWESGRTNTMFFQIETVHPVVRVHPVTGWKSIFVDPASTRYIVGVPKAESDMILKYLFELVA
jgi:sulfonate dioxygenase